MHVAELPTESEKQQTAPYTVRRDVSAPPSMGRPLSFRECLTFRLGDEDYGIDILRVQEIRGYEAPTRIADAPAHVKGVLNLRGVIVPVVDLRLHFNLENVAYDAMTVVIVVNVTCLAWFAYVV